MVFVIHWHESAMDLHVFTMPYFDGQNKLSNERDVWIVRSPTISPFSTFWVFILLLLSCHRVRIIGLFMEVLSPYILSFLFESSLGYMRTLGWVSRRRKGAPSSGWSRSEGWEVGRSTCTRAWTTKPRLPFGACVGSGWDARLASLSSCVHGHVSVPFTAPLSDTWSQCSSFLWLYVHPPGFLVVVGVRIRLHGRVAITSCRIVSSPS